MRLSVQDVAAIFGVPERTVYRWVRQEGLPASDINDQLRFNRAQVLEWATSQNLSPVTDIYAPQAGSLPGVYPALAAGGVFHNVPGDDKPSVLRAVVERMKLPEGVDRQFLLQILLARESMGSTAVGDGIAIPHVRNPIVLDVPLCAVSLCFLARPIEFGAVDGRPVHTLFTLISPNVRAHLHMLSRLVHMLRDPGFKQLLAAQAPEDRVLAAVQRLQSAMPGGPGT